MVKGARMKKVMFLAFVISSLFCCGPGQEKVEKLTEDGVQVVVNHLEPYKVKGSPSQLALEEELKIDLERSEFEHLGLKNPEEMDADSEGNIYIYDKQRASDYFILKFDKQGKFVKEFGRKGQGPAEIQNLMFMRVSARDEVLITDWNKKILAFDKDGAFLRESKYNPRWYIVTPLENGNYLATGSQREITNEGTGMRLVLYSPNFEEIKKIEFFDMSRYPPDKKHPFGIPLFYWRVKNGKIYVGNENRGYEIQVYDFDGNFLRKIRKEYKPVKYPEEFKKSLETMVKSRSDIYLLDFTPPFNSFFIDDDDRLFVMTYEQDENNEEYIHDVFNTEGIFIGRKSLGLTGMLGQGLNHRWAVARNNRYYRLRFDADGYAELIVYRTIWQ
jgi:hypothetical protein